MNSVEPQASISKNGIDNNYIDHNCMITIIFDVILNVIMQNCKTIKNFKKRN